MAKSRIAIFSGFAAPFAGRRGGRRAPRRIGAPIFDNPRMSRYADMRTLPPGYGAPIFDNPRMSSLGRRGYYVPAGPTQKPYKVKARRNSPKMKAAMNRFKKAAKSCSRRTKNSRTKGAFQRCMKTSLRKGRSKR